MGYEISDAITDLIFKSEPDLAARLRSQDEALRETPCAAPELGRWFAAYDAAYLLAVIELGDEAFLEEFPVMAQVGAEARARLLAALAAHPDACPRCGLKRGYDFEMGGRVERACDENREYLLRLLGEEEAEAEEGHAGGHAEGADGGGDG